MSVYVLIIYFTTYSASGGLALTAAEFADKPSCQYAAVQAEKMAGPATRVKHVCVPKDYRP